MRILSEFEIKENINTFQGIALETQQELRTQNCYVIIQIATGFNDHVSKLIVSGAMVLINYFFVNRSYYEYDRVLMCTAALYLSTKMNGQHRRIEYYAFGYHNINNKLTNGDEIIKPLSDEMKEEIIEKITNAELQIVKTMFGKDGGMVGVDLPYKYISDYVYKLFKKENINNIFYLATWIVNDACFTVLPLTFGPKEIAFACVIIASRQLGCPMDKITPEKLKRMIRGDSDKDSKKGSAYCNFDEVITCISKITKFYSDMKEKEKARTKAEEKGDSAEKTPETVETPKDEENKE
ncbi:unnamed protein product [Moneuplotes crassus]|uniref:Cyclin n=1 Tax=Euplotes crassus TaxID=5936 RepID=A0AAD2D0M8_EUPCR|nr:unnamed protein product [Moneuplotes crassus]